MTEQPPYGQAWSPEPSMVEPERADAASKARREERIGWIVGVVIAAPILVVGGCVAGAASGGQADEVAALQQRLVREQAQTDLLRAEVERAGQEVVPAVPPAVPPAEPPAEAPAPPDQEPVDSDPSEGLLGDGSWTSTLPDIRADSVGDFSGAARVTNEGTSERSAYFKWSFFVQGELVGSADGTVQGVSPGETVTVDLLSLDDFRDDVDEISFQLDLEF